MRAAALVLLALATQFPRWLAVRVVLAVLAGVGLVYATWDDSFAGRANGWAVPCAVLMVASLCWAAPLMGRSLADLGGAWGLLCGCALAVYSCVPETDQMREVAVVLVAGWVAEMVLRRRLPDAALVAAAGLLAWSALFGATGRPSALVGGLFALAPVVAAAAWWCAAERATSRPRAFAGWIVGVVWVGAAGAVSRTGGISPRLRPAIVAVIVAAVGAAVATVLVYMIVPRSARDARSIGDTPSTDASE